MVADTYNAEGLANGHGHYNGGEMQNRSVDDHFAFFKSLCEKANDYYLVQKARGTYDATKHSWGFLERTLDKVEGRVQDATQYTAPIYEHYLFPATDRLLGYYNRSLETSKCAVDKTKTTAFTAGTLGLGLALVATQMGLIAGTAATNLFLDGLIATKQAGGKVISKGISVEQTAEQYIQNAIRVSKELVNQPKEKATEHANTFLDISNAVFERLLNLEPANEDPESSLSQRIAHLARRIGGDLFWWTTSRKQQQWTFQQAGQLSASVNELRTKVESEAKQALTTPEEALLRSIRHSSAKLNEHLLKLRVSAAEILHESVQKKLESASAYVEQLDLDFVKAENIYQVKDEVLEEAMSKLHEIAQWSTLVPKNNQNGGAAGSSSMSNQY
uniref:Uncharacterized protein n=1 Tax=Ditylenchus dipsaci TaxID=166011 RepID=A0A915ENS0_9BILA